jgi:hypothetical protein
VGFEEGLNVADEVDLVRGRGRRRDEGDRNRGDGETNGTSFHGRLVS